MMIGAVTNRNSDTTVSTGNRRLLIDDCPLPSEFSGMFSLVSIALILS